MLHNNKCQTAFITRQSNLDYHQRMQISLLTTYQLFSECWSEAEQRQRQQEYTTLCQRAVEKVEENNRHSVNNMLLGMCC